jgi:amino acid permease
LTYSAVRRVNCFHREGYGAGDCNPSGSTYMVVFGLFQLLLSQLPSLHNIAWLSVVAVATSFGYSFISLGLCAAKWAAHGDLRGTLAGGAFAAAKPFDVLLALGNIAFSYTFAHVLIEIQDTLRAPPAENRTMKRASFYGLGMTTVFYLLLGCTGYAAFGNDAPGNILTGSAFYEPFWLVDIANVCVIVHLIGAYQVLLLRSLSFSLNLRFFSSIDSSDQIRINWMHSGVRAAHLRKAGELRGVPLA